jgi:hypothetical protein
MIDESSVYFLGSWRRCPFDPTMMPQSLNVDEGSGTLRLSDFDSEYNNLWRFETVMDMFFLVLTNPSPALRRKFPSKIYVSTSLGLTDKATNALAVSLESYEPFRKGPMDVGMQIFASDGSVLLSNEKTGRVLLVELSDAEQRADMNIAWEATPDSDDALQGTLEDVPAWLHDILIA